MSRKAVPRDLQNAVILSSRRRCCICFGLDRDTRLAPGQIAHLDGDRNNNSEDNLAFLCFVHHDEYDSRTSQRKNFTVDEVKHYRAELVSAINQAFTQRVHFGEITTPPQDPYAGQYVRLGEGDSAEINLTPLPDSYEGDAQYYVQGLAFWGSDRTYGPNLGTLEFVGHVTDDRQIIYRRRHTSDGYSETKIRLLGKGVIEVQEENWIGEYGMNVTFIGVYQRALAT